MVLVAVLPPLVLFLVLRAKSLLVIFPLLVLVLIAGLSFES